MHYLPCSYPLSFWNWDMKQLLNFIYCASSAFAVKAFQCFPTFPACWLSWGKLRFFAELQEGEDGGSFEKKGGVSRTSAWLLHVSHSRWLAGFVSEFGICCSGILDSRSEALSWLRDICADVACLQESGFLKDMNAYYGGKCLDYTCCIMLLHVEKRVRLAVLSAWTANFHACDPLVDCQLSLLCFGTPGYCNILQQQTVVA